MMNMLGFVEDTEPKKLWGMDKPEFFVGEELCTCLVSCHLWEGLHEDPEGSGGTGIQALSKISKVQHQINEEDSC